MTRSTLLIIVAMLIGMPVLAMIKTMPFPDLVKTAEAVVIAKVDAQEIIQAPGAKAPSTQTSLIVEKVFKGDLKAAAPLQFTTAGSKGHVVLDHPVFPEKGERVMLFLAKKEDGSWRLLNGVQGLWPLEAGTDKTLGMGFNYSIKQVEEQLNK